MQKKYEKEHVTPYIWDNPNLFKLSNYSLKKLIITTNIDSHWIIRKITI